MRSTITSRGQTVIPAAIRRQFHLSPSDCLEWLVEDGLIRVVPVRANPIDAFRGQGKGGATERLLASRKQDEERAELVHKDPEFEAIDLPHLHLPCEKGHG